MVQFFYAAICGSQDDNSVAISWDIRMSLEKGIKHFLNSLVAASWEIQYNPFKCKSKYSSGS